MSKYKVSLQFDNEHAKSYKITRQQALETVENPDQTMVKRDEAETEICTLSMKLMGPADRPYHLLVVTRPDGNEQVIMSAWPVYPELVKNIPDLTPIAALRALAERFGLPLQVGRKTAKFVHDVSFPFPRGGDPQQFIQIPDIEKHRCLSLSECHFRFDEAKARLYIAMAFVLDVTALSRFVDERRRGGKGPKKGPKVKGPKRRPGRG